MLWWHILSLLVKAAIDFAWFLWHSLIVSLHGCCKDVIAHLFAQLPGFPAEGFSVKGCNSFPVGSRHFKMDYWVHCCICHCLRLHYCPKPCIRKPFHVKGHGLVFPIVCIHQGVFHDLCIDQVPVFS